MLPSLADLSQPWQVDSADTMEALGAALASALPDDHVLTLRGDLGTGKTTLVRGIARGLGIEQNIHSPTYAIYTTYPGRRHLIHMDAYRLGSADELEALDLSAVLISPFIWVVEWPENVAEALPDDATHLALSIRNGQHFIQQSPAPFSAM